MKKIIHTILFIVFLIMIIKGNTIIGYKGIGVMMVGLSGLLSQLYLYNKKLSPKACFRGRNEENL